MKSSEIARHTCQICGVTYVVASLARHCEDKHLKSEHE